MQQATPSSQPPGDSRDLRNDELELWDRVLKRWNEHLGRQFKIGVGVVSFALVVVGFLGVRSLGMMIEDAVETGAKSAVSNAQEDIDRDTKRLSEQLADRLATIAVDMAQLQRQTKRAQELIAEMEAARDRFAGIEAELENRIKSVEAEVGRVDRIATSLALAAAPSQGQEQTATASPDAEPAVFSALNIRQVPTPLDKPGSASTRQIYLLTLSAAIEDGTPAAESWALLNAVESVTYTLSDKWFKPNVFTQKNRNDNFQFSVTVWGVTPIKAKAQFIGKAEPICWAGSMNLKQEAKLARTACDG